MYTLQKQQYLVLLYLFKICIIITTMSLAFYVIQIFIEEEHKPKEAACH